MVEGLAPGDWVRNPLAPEWGLGQVQSVIGDRVTANFENAGKRLINAAVVSLTRVTPPAPPAYRTALHDRHTKLSLDR